MALKYAAMGVAALSAAAVAGAGYGSLRAINELISLQEASQATIAFVSLIKDAESSARGFVITGDEAFLQPWHETSRTLSESQARLKVSVSDLEMGTPSPQGLINLADTKIEWSRRIIDSRRTSPSTAMALVQSGDGEDVMNELRTSASQLVANIDAKTDAQWRLISQRYLPLGVSGLVGLIVSIAGLLFMVSRESRATSVARNLMQTVMAGAPVGLALTADGARINSANRAFLELFAGSGERRLREIPPHIQSAMKARTAVGATGDTVTHELAIERDGGQRFIRLTTFPVRIDGENGKLRDGTGIAAVDLTDEKMLEQNLAAARDDAEAANLAKSTFLANMSHELRTPLTAIIGYCELLQEETAEAGNEEVQADLDKINGNARHLLALINDVLDLSKIEAQKMDVHAVSFSLETLLNDVEDAVGALVEKNRNVFTVTNTAGQVTLHTDDLKLKQILLNLVGNAAKFTTNGQINVDVSRAETQAGDALTFNVSDTGIGMSPDQLKNLFTRFNQADATTTRRFGGSGLGLALTKVLAGMLGGTVSVESLEGHGSTFTLQVPVTYVAPAVQADVMTSKSEASGHATGQLVLIADDQRASREILERHLARSGFRTMSVTTGTEVLMAIKQERPAAVLLDVMMPGLDGWHVLRTLRESPETRDIPVIMQTVLDERHFAYTLGADGYLKKPIRRDDLLSAIADSVREEHPQVLLVENDQTSANLIAEQFEDTPWQVTRANSAQEALDEIDARTTPPHVILVSANLPDDAGFQLVSGLRRVPALQHTKIYLLTANRDSRLISSTEAAGTPTVAKTETAIRNLVEDLRHLTDNTKQKGSNHGTHSAG